MDPMINPGAGPTRVRLTIARAGQKVTVREASEPTNTDPLNNTPASDQNWVDKGETLVYRYYPTQWQGNDEQVDGTGEYNEDRPLMAFPPDTIASDGDRLTYNGEEYELENRIDRDYYEEWTAKEVDE